MPWAAPPGGGERPPAGSGILPLLIAGAISVGASGLWLVRHQGPPRGDEVRYYGMTLSIREALADLGPDLLHRLSETHPTHPPLQPLAAALLLPIAGRDIRALSFALGALSVAGILWAFHILARASARAAAVPAAFLLAGTPVFVLLSRSLLTDGPAAALTMLSLAFLARSGDFARPRPAAAAGLCAALALLVKWTVVPALAPPFLVAGARALSARRARGIFLAAGPVLLVAGPWYAAHAGRMGGFFRWNEEAAFAAVGEGPLDPETLLFYVRRLPHLLGWAGLVAGAAGLLFGRVRAAALASSALSVFLVFSAIRSKSDEGRYLLPAVPPLLFLAGSAFARLPRPLRRIAGGAAAPFVLAAALPAAGLLGRGAPLDVLAEIPRFPALGLPFPPSPGTFGEREVHRLAMSLLSPERRLFLAADFWPLDGHFFRYRLLRDGLPLSLGGPPYAERGADPERTHTSFEELLDAGVAVWKDVLPVASNLRDTARFHIAWTRFLNDPPPAFLGNHEAPRKVPLADHTRAVILARSRPADLEERREVAAASLRMNPLDPKVFRALARWETGDAARAHARAAAGVALAAAGDARGGEAALAEAARLAPADALLLEAWAEVALAAGLRETPIEAAKRAGNGGRGSLLRARALLAAGQADRAIEVFRVAASDPWDESVWEGLASAQEGLGLSEEARRSRLRAGRIRHIRLEPIGSLVDQVTLARELMEEQRFRDAVPLLRSAVVIHPGDPGPAAWLLISVGMAAGPGAARAELEDLMAWNDLARREECRLRKLLRSAAPSSPPTSERPR